jgi:hypothetical protein
MDQKVEHDEIEDNKLRIKAQKILLHQRIHKLLQEWDQQRKDKANEHTSQDIMGKESFNDKHSAT